MIQIHGYVLGQKVAWILQMCKTQQNEGSVNESQKKIEKKTSNLFSS